MHRHSATELIATALYAASEFTVRAVIVAAIVLFVVVTTRHDNVSPGGQVGISAQGAAASSVSNGGTPHGSEQGPLRGRFEPEP